MSDIIDRAARVLHEHYSRTDGLDVTAQESAQALADAGLLARTVPTREEIAQHVADEHGFQAVHEADSGTVFCAKCGKWFDSWDYTKHIADAVLELLAAQPTIAEIKASALEEAAEIVETHRQQRRKTIGPIDEETMDPLLVQAHDSGSAALTDAKSLILNRAQQIRDGK